MTTTGEVYLCEICGKSQGNRCWSRNAGLLRSTNEICQGLDSIVGEG